MNEINDMVKDLHQLKEENDELILLEKMKEINIENARKDSNPTKPFSIR